MTAIITKKYNWNNRSYCNIRYADETCVTLSTELDAQYTDEQWIQLALDYYASLPEEIDPVLQIVRSCPDSMLVDEVIRRHLKLVAQGEVI